MTVRSLTARITGFTRLLWWQLIVTASLMMLGAVVLGLPPWSLGPLEMAWLGLVIAAYLVSTLAPSLYWLANTRLPHLVVVLLTASVFAAAWLISPALESDWLDLLPYLSGNKNPDLHLWRIPLNLVLTAAVFSVVWNTVLMRGGKPRSAFLLALAGLLTLLILGSLPDVRGPWIYWGLDKSQVRETEAYGHRLRIHYFRDRLPHPGRTGGALADLGDRLLLMAGDGGFHEVHISDDSRRMNLRNLNQQAPVNFGAFIAANPKMSGFPARNFRASDLLVVGSLVGEGKTLLVSHHYFHAEHSCYTVRLSMLTSPWRDFISGAEPAQWKTIYEARPCLPLQVDGKFLFAGHQTGGALALTSRGTVLLTLGEGAHDGVQSPHVVSQDMSSDFGKIVEIDPVSGARDIVSSGHRSPSGLHIDAEQRIWQTEHGPRGGDELNRVRYGANYGWPLRTLGTQYGKLTWPKPDVPGSQEDFEPPAFAWTPSIAISALTSIRRQGFYRWQGDLIVSTLGDRSLYRVHLAEGHPVLAEPIPVYERVRDVVEDSQGRLVFWTDRAAIGLVEAER